MSFTLPQTWTYMDRELVVTACDLDAWKRTVVAVTFDNVAMGPFTIPYDVVAQGFDGLRPKIEFLVGGIVDDDIEAGR